MYSTWRSGLSGRPYALDVLVMAANPGLERIALIASLRRFAPAWMRQHTLAVAIVTDLWAGPSRPPGLRRLAEYLGVAA
jgi:hypothetical protein